MLLFLILYQVGSEIFYGIHYLYAGHSATKIWVTLNVIWFICDMLLIYQIFVYSTIFNSAALRRLRMVFRMFFLYFLLRGFDPIPFRLAYNFFRSLIPSLPQLDFSYETLYIASNSLIPAAIVIMLVFYLQIPIKRFLNGPLPGLEISLDDITISGQPYEKVAPAEATRLFSFHLTGLVWISGGIILFVLGAGLLDIEGVDKFAARFRYYYQILGVESHADNGKALIFLASMFIVLSGFYCVQRGRKYFVPTAEAVLAIDKRDPILYLRSFLDDKAHAFSDWIDIAGTSVEMELSKYFRPFGPFVAIGSPEDRLPKLGAIRLMRSDGEWQKEVASLMASSRWIVAAVGSSGWIKWEISEIIAKTYLGKALFVFPDASFGRKRREQQERRFQTLAERIPTDFAAEVAHLDKSEFLEAYVHKTDKTVLITCHENLSSPFVSAVVAHYFLMKSDGTSSASLDDVTIRTSDALPSRA